MCCIIRHLHLVGHGVDKLVQKLLCWTRQWRGKHGGIKGGGAYRFECSSRDDARTSESSNEFLLAERGERPPSQTLPAARSCSLARPADVMRGKGHQAQ